MPGAPLSASSLRLPDYHERVMNQHALRSSEGSDAHSRPCWLQCSWWHTPRKGVSGAVHFTQSTPPSSFIKNTTFGDVLVAICESCVYNVESNAVLSRGDGQELDKVRCYLTNSLPTFDHVHWFAFGTALSKATVGCQSDCFQMRAPAASRRQLNYSGTSCAGGLWNRPHKRLSDGLLAPVRVLHVAHEPFSTEPVRAIWRHAG